MNEMHSAVIVAPASGDEWHEARRKGIGGTDISAIAGINPWKSALAVYYEKTTGEDITEPNEKMQWGNILEPVIADHTAERYDLVLDECPYILAHPEYPWALATVDRIIIDEEKGNGVLEIKNMGHWSSTEMKKNEGEESIPDHYLLQMQWYLFVTGLKWGMFSALMDGSELHVVKIQRDDKLISNLISIASDFWECVGNNTPPSADGSEATEAIIKKMYPEATKDKDIDLDPEYENLISDVLRLKGDIKAKQSELKGLENKIRLAMADAESAKCGAYELTYKSSPRKSYVVRESIVRTLRIKGE